MKSKFGNVIFKFLSFTVFYISRTTHSNVLLKTKQNLWKKTCSGVHFLVNLQPTNLLQNFSDKFLWQVFFFKYFVNLLKLRNGCFKKAFSVAASVCVTYFGIVEGVNFFNKTTELLQICFFFWKYWRKLKEKKG